MNIVQLFARIGLKTDEGKAKSFHRAMTTVKAGLIATTAIAAGTSITIKRITTDAMAAAVAFKQFEVETGSSAQELQKWQSVAEQTNQSADSVSSAIKAIVSNQEKIKLGQGDISGYQILGIDPRQDPFKILEDLRNKSRGLSEGMKKNILSQIGVGTGLLQTLNLTREKFDEMAGRAWIISPQAIKTLNDTKSSVDLVARGVKYMKTQIAVGLSPEIKKATKDFQVFLKLNEKDIIKVFKVGFKYVSEFVRAISSAGSAMNIAIRSTIGWENSLKILLGIMVALNAAFLLSPIGLITTGLILLVAVLDDLNTYSKGGKSLFGELLKGSPDLEKNLLGGFNTIKDVLTLIKGFATGDLNVIDSIASKWGEFGKTIKNLYSIFKNLLRIKDEIIDVFFNSLIKKFPELEKPLRILKDLIKFLSTPFKIFSPSESILEAWRIFSNALKLARDSFKELKDLDVFKSITKQVGGSGGPGFLDTVREKLTNFSFSSAPQATGSKGSVTQNNKISVTVTGNADPVETGNAAAAAIQRQINSASAQLSRDQ